jgi:hypothetical protein
MSLADDFHHEMVSTIEQAKRLGYIPTYFIRMLDQYSGVETAKRLLAQVVVQEGLMKLWELGALNISMEASVIKEKYCSLFTEDEIREAHRRLEELDYFK